jgi:CheY-like chemotaxis protein
MTEQKKVLIIDDNVLAADAIVRLLRALGWSAESRYSPSAAQEYFKTEHPDVAILDIGMPEMDGYTLVGILRNDLHVTVPIIALTGYGLGEDRERAFEAGFTAHLTKPVGMSDLQETLTRLVGKHSEVVV